jgi:hypothetical protein
MTKIQLHIHQHTCMCSWIVGASAKVTTMSGIRKSTSCRQLFKDCKILTVTLLYILEVLCFIKKYKMAVQKINKYMITIQAEIWIYILNHVTQIFIKSVINMGIRLYNKVPNNIKKIEEYKPYEENWNHFSKNMLFIH